MTAMTIECAFHIRRQNKGRKQVRGGAPAPRITLEPGRVPRVAKLMALALRFEELVQTGKVKDYAELARLGQVTRARMSQIMNLLNLAPDIQEAILFLPRTEHGRDPVILAQLQPIAGAAEWARQRKMWRELTA